MPLPLPSILIAEHSACRRPTSVALRVASWAAVSVTAKLAFWMCVDHARTVAIGLSLVGSGQAPATVAVETILIAPVLRVTPVSGLPVMSVFTDNVRSPSGETKQLQHSDISWCWSNTNTAAHKFPPAVHGLVKRTVASGAPAVFAFAK